MEAIRGRTKSGVLQYFLAHGSTVIMEGGGTSRTLAELLKNSYFTKDQVNALIAGIEQFDAVRVDVLPTPSASTLRTLFFAPTGTNGTYEVWVTLADDSGSTTTYAMYKLQLANTYTKQEIDEMISLAAMTPIMAQTGSTVTIDPNVLNVWYTPIAELTISLGAGTSGYANEYMMQFTCPSDAATVLTMPNGIRWMNDDELLPEAGQTYQISILGGLAVYAGWEAANT